MKRHSQNHLAHRSRLARRGHLARSDRRGALLLVVLSMLVLFAMIGLTFVVTAGHFRRAADASLRAEPVEHDPAREMDTIAKYLIRGPQVGSRSVIQGHDFLRDMYGNVSIEFPRVDGVDVSRPQMTRIRVLLANLPQFPAGNPAPDNGVRVSKIEDYYSGTVLTFTTGAAAGQSHRVLRYIPQFEADGETFQYVDFFIDPEPETNRGRMVNNAANQMARPVPGDSFLVNGHPFSGTGIGYFANTSDPALPKPGLTMRTRGVNPADLTTPSQPVALLPNISYMFPGGIEPISGLSIEGGGANESYTAPDYQNMYLAYIPLDGGLSADQISQRTLPSFHRPDLWEYWLRQLAEDDPDFAMLSAVDQRAAFRNPMNLPAGNLRNRVIEMLRRISLRPLQVDHPNFTGSNLIYDPFGRNTSRWDIDNDLDGIPDSVWIDPGLPIKTDKQGRRYRPLVAILVRDLDALLNVNAHGFYSHLAGFNNTNAGLAATTAEATVLHNTPSHSPSRDAGNNAIEMRLPLGSGYGPADVNLISLFRPDSALSLFQNRYAAIAGMGTELPLARPGLITNNDPLSRLSTLGVPNLSAANPLLASQFGTPPDRLGHGYTYLDYEGKPRWMQLQPSSDFSQTVDDPYEANLYRREQADRHFTYDDLERVLRYEEYDSSQLQSGGDRLLTAGYNTLVRDPSAPANILEPARKRRLITSGSWQVPTPARVPVPRDGHTEARLNASIETPTISTLLHARIEDANPTWSEADVNRAMLALLPSEMLKGEKLDLNRLLEAPPTNAGGSAEDVFTLAAKQLEEFQSSFAASGAYGVEGKFTNGTRIAGSPFNLPTPPGWGTPGPANATSYSVSRQLMARHLYVLMLLVTDPNYVHPAVDPTLGQPERRELTLRRIAQWAVNVVDYRDKDGVMTPFEYDLNPFNDSEGSGLTTWNVDGNLTTNEGGNRRVVWGAEAPDLIMTETLAFHDRRTRDTEWDDDLGERRSVPGMPGEMVDETLDQYRIPQGSLFMEFYNPRNTTGAPGGPMNASGALNTTVSTQPRDLYANDGRLHLNRLTPNGFPVWRVVITSTELDTDANPQRENIIDSMKARQDTVNFQPVSPTDNTDPAGFRMLGVGNSLENYEAERFVYFANRNVINAALHTRSSYYYRGTDQLGIFPGQYFVVGPRQRTVIGTMPKLNEPDFNVDGAQVIELLGLNSSFTGMPYPATGQIKPFLGIAVTAEFPENWGMNVPNDEDPDGLPRGIGLSISEPIANNDYYEKPTERNDDTISADFPNGLMDLYTDGPTGAVRCPDVPFDTDNPDYPLSLSDAATDRNIAQTGTHPDKDPGEYVTSESFMKGFKTAILQRLANPLSDFHAELNPYISVDAMPIDLTVYNGEDSPDNPQRDPAVQAEDWDPDEEDTDENGNDSRSARVEFASRERGRRNLEAEVNPNSPGFSNLEADVPNFGQTGNLHGMMSRLGVDIAGDATSMNRVVNQTPPHFPTERTLTNTDNEPEHFGRVLRHTLGYVNRNFGVPMSTGPADGAYVGSIQPFEPNRLLNPLDPTAGTAPVENNPFGWLQWSNRPYVSAYELMQVPSSSPQRLLYEYTYGQQQAGVDVDPYAFISDGDDTRSHKAPYGHLLNFFHTSDSLASDTGSTVPNASQGSHYARIFDFVHVPTRFNDAYKWFPVNDFNPNYIGLAANDPRIGYQFPFNKRSRFREPGKINLNTIPAQDVYHAIFDPRLWSQYPGMSFPTWEQFQQSRRGYQAGENADFPSRFSNPFRAASGAEMMSEVGAPGDAANIRNRLRKRPTEATILRSRQGTDLPNPNRTPLFDYRVEGGAASEHRHHNPHANPMFRYQAHQRLGNIAGTQSNVFAVWMTIGYFELEPVPVDAAHPDGWALGEEKGTDTGDIRRHRGFYIIDRSIPVGYQTGRDHNVENVIQLKRFIE